MTERKTWDEMRERMQEWEQKSKCFKERTNEGECQPLKRVQEWMKKGTNENQNKMTQWKKMTEKKKDWIKEEKLEKKKILEEENGRAKNEYRKYKLMKEMTQ